MPTPAFMFEKIIFFQNQQENLFTQSRISFDVVDNYETAGLIAGRMDDIGCYSGGVVVASGMDFPDALAASAYAARLGYPIVLSAKDRIPGPSQAALTDLAPEGFYVVGGSGVISDEVMAQLSNPVRISGSNRYATATELARYFQPGSSRCYIATGSEFADAIAGGVLAAKNDAGLLLVSKIVPEVVEEYIIENNMQDGTIFGGTGAVSEIVESSIGNIIESSATAVGNTPGNLRNGGVVAYYDGWVFYSAREAGIFRMRNNGDDHEKISDDEAGYLNVSDGWVYYVNRDDNDRIYRMHLNGNNRRPITDEMSSCLATSNGWIWHITDDMEAETSSVCRIRPDGSGREVLAVSNPWDDSSLYTHFFEDIQIVDCWVYYLSAESQFGIFYDLYRLNLDTGKKDTTFFYNFIDLEIFNTYLVAGNTLWYSDEDGNPIEDAFVGVNQEGYENYGYTDSSGSLTLYLSEGEFEFTSRALGYYDSRGVFSVSSDTELNIVLVIPSQLYEVTFFLQE